MDTSSPFGMLSINSAELIESIPKGEEVSIYFHGDWHDLCRGPHLSSTGKVGKFFKLTKVSGAPETFVNLKNFPTFPVEDKCGPLHKSCQSP